MGGTKSSLAETTSLTVTVNSTDYELSFDETNTAMVGVLSSDAIPAQITVKDAVLSEKGAGLANNEVLTLANGSKEIVITAEDGTTATYTIAVVAVDLSATEIAKTDEGNNRRFHYVLFNISAAGVIVNSCG